jgi:outer membrane protein
MKRIICIFQFALLFALTGFSQQTAVIDVSTILESQTAYQNAQTQLDQIAAQWRQEIAQSRDEITSLYNKYQAEHVLLSEDMRKQREDEIMAKEQEVMELQRQRFGSEGDLFKKREELVQPIQDLVYKEIEDYATNRGIDLIFDVNGTIVYMNAQFDKTRDIIDRLKN